MEVFLSAARRSAVTYQYVTRGLEKAPADHAARGGGAVGQVGTKTYRILKFVVFFRAEFLLCDRGQYSERSGSNFANIIAGCAALCYHH